MLLENLDNLNPSNDPVLEMNYLKCKNSGNNKYLIISGSYDGSLGVIEFHRVYRKPTFAIIEKAHSAGILCLLQNKLDNTIISASNDGVVKVWSKDLKNITTLRGHNKAVTSIVLDGYFLFTGSEDCNIVMWNILTRQKLKTFNHHKSYVSSLRLIQDSGLIISTSRDGTLLMWDYTTSSIIFNYSKENYEFVCAVFDRIRKDFFIGTTCGTILRISLIEADKIREDIETKKRKDGMEDQNSCPVQVEELFNIDEKLANIAEKYNGDADRRDLPINYAASFNIFQAKKDIDSKIKKKIKNKELHYKK
jgi:WD40 repeat protein